MYTLGGSRQPAFQHSATYIPSSSTPPMFQFQAQLLSTPRTNWPRMRFGTTTFSRHGGRPAAGRRSCRVTVDTTTGFDSAVTVGGRRSDTVGRRSDTGRQSDTGCCRLVAGGHGDTVPRPARTTGRQGT
jgi:hypothetical protein